MRKKRAVAGLIINFLIFWKGHNVALYEEYQVSENLSYTNSKRFKLQFVQKYPALFPVL